MKLPKNYQIVMPYLILKGCEKLIEFAKQVFNARELQVYRTDSGQIMHAEIEIGGCTIMMGEASDQWGQQNAGLYINVEDADDSFARALKHGASVVMPIEDKQYGRTCGVKDPTGNTWWITTPKEI
jgi:uncharacterized glyoxalase superfamily protein PhnB